MLAVDLRSYRNPEITVIKASQPVSHPFNYNLVADDSPSLLRLYNHL